MPEIDHTMTIRLSFDEARAARLALGLMSVKKYREAGFEELTDAGNELHRCLCQHLPAEP